jgi:1-acyl-sn-glycerol-3-phosphate acyltransferase
MLIKLIRGIKGFFMTALFGLFLGGILIELFFALPLIWFLDRIFGPEPDRMQLAHRILLSFWIMMLRLCRLLSAKPTNGKPFDGPCVVVSNHPGLFDVLFLICDIPRLSILVKRTLAQKLPLGPIFRSAGYVLSTDIAENNPLESMMGATEKLRRGYKFLIFPEGTRSPKGGLRKFKVGAFRIARMTNVPIQPVLIRNTPPFMPKEDKWYFPPWQISRLEMEFWEPIPPPETGKEKEYTQMLENRYKHALGLEQII